MSGLYFAEDADGAARLARLEYEILENCPLPLYPFSLPPAPYSSKGQSASACVDPNDFRNAQVARQRARPEVLLCVASPRSCQNRRARRISGMPVHLR